MTNGQGVDRRVVSVRMLSTHTIAVRHTRERRAVAREDLARARRKERERLLDNERAEAVDVEDEVGAGRRRVAQNRHDTL